MTDVAIYQPGELTPAVQPSGPLDDWIMVADKVVKLAQVICQSPFVPDGLRGSVPATAAAILTGRELGIPPMTSLANIHVIHGKPGLSALVMRALIMSQGHEWQDVEVTDTRVKVRGRRKGETEWTEASFSRDQAATAKIQLGGYPQDKLYARATSRLARRKFADVIAGMPYSAEELEDGVTDEVSAAVPAPVTEQPKARTAQRKTRQRERVPSVLEDGEGNVATPSHPPLPPLPGEDEPDPTPAPGATQTTHQDSPAPAGDRSDRHRQLVGIVRAHFKRLGYTDGEDEQRLIDTAALAGVSFELGSTNDLDESELSTVADALARCKNRDRLRQVLTAASDAPGGDTNG